MKRLHRALCAVLVAAGAAACDNTTAPDLNWQLQVALTSGSNRPSVGDQVQFAAFIVSAGSNANITEDSVNVTALSTWEVVGTPGIVSITPAGLVTALAPGAVAVQATYGGKTSNQSLIVE